MTTATANQHVYNSNISAKTFNVGTAWVYHGLSFISWDKAQHSLKNFFARIAAIPVTLAVVVILKILNSFLRKELGNNLQLRADNYHKTWAFYKSFHKTAEKLKGLDEAALNAYPWYIRLCLKQLLFTAQITVDLYTKVEKKFVDLDTPYSSLPNGVRVVSTSDLWETRMKKYDFLV